MYKCFITLCVVLWFGMSYWCLGVSFRQERAKVRYENPKYIKDVVVFTARKGRNQPYLTNMTATLLMPYGNNVSFAITMLMASGGDFRIVAKVCDTVKTKWMRDYMVQYTNLTLSKCPFPAGRFTYMNMELPPKNLPLPITDGDYTIMYELCLTATKEKILEVGTILHFDQKQKTRKG